MQRDASVLFRKYGDVCCVQNGPPPRRDEGACPMRPVTENRAKRGSRSIFSPHRSGNQRWRRAIFNAALRAGRLLAIFHVARSASVTHTQALRSRLENRQNPLRQMSPYFLNSTLASASRTSRKNQAGVSIRKLSRARVPSPPGKVHDRFYGVGNSPGKC